MPNFRAAVVVLALYVASAETSPCANGECGVDSDEEVLLQRRAIHRHDDEKPRGNGVAGLMKQADRLKTLVQSGVRIGNSTSSGLTDKALGDLIESLTYQMEFVVMPAIEDEHKSDVAKISSSISAITGCSSKFDAAGVLAKKNVKNTEQTAHNTCRDAELIKKTASEAATLTLDTFVNALSEPSGSLSLPAGATKSSDFEAIKNTLFSLKTWYVEKKEAFVPKWTAQKAALAAYTTQRATCSQKQSLFEQSFCQFKTHTALGCSQYDTCHWEKKHAYTGVTKVDVQADEASRKAEWKAAKLIKCFLSLLNETKVNTKMSTCTDMIVSTSDLDIAYPDVPAKTACELSDVTAAPCSSNFLSTQYTSQGWHTGGVVQHTCIPCSATWLSEQDALCDSNFASAAANTLDECRQACLNQAGCSEFSFPAATGCRVAKSASGCAKSTNNKSCHDATWKSAASTAVPGESVCGFYKLV